MPRSHGPAAGPAEAPIIAGFAAPLDSGAAPPGRSDAARSDLIGDVYDAALDDGLWPGVLHKAAAFVGGCAASVYSKDSVHRTAEITHHVGIDDAFKRSCLDGYVKIDPTTPGFFFCGVGEVVNTPDILPCDEFLQSRFYAEWVAPQGLVDMVTTVLDKSATSYAVFSVFRHARDGLADEGARHRMRLLAPHVRRAVQIGRTVTLDRAEAATFLVDATGRIVDANRADPAVVADGTVMRAARGQLLATLGRFVPPPPQGLRPPTLWGTAARLDDLFPDGRIRVTKRIFNFRYRSPDHWIDVFRTCFGPVCRVFEILEPAARAALRTELVALLTRMTRAGPGSLVAPSEYLEAVVIAS